MNIKIFRANRGEGKTKWLFERAVEAKESGCKLVYIGNAGTMCGLINMWQAEMHEVCPIINASKVFTFNSNTTNYCFLTDEYVNNMEPVGFWSRIVNDIDATWYITMDTKDFVN